MVNTKKNSAKLFVAILLALLMCSPLMSIAFAATDDNDVQVPPEESSAADSEPPTLYASEEDENPMLIQGNDDVADTA
jgi:hypothetical protein